MYIRRNLLPIYRYWLNINFFWIFLHELLMSSLNLDKDTAPMFYVLYNKRAGLELRVYCTASKTNHFVSFIDEKIFKIDFVWAGKSRKKFIKNGQACLYHI